MRTRRQELEQPALPATDIKQIAERRSDGQFDQGLVQEAVLVAASLAGRLAPGTQLAQFVEIASKLGLILRQQRKQPSPQLCDARSLGHPVVNEVPVPEAFEQVRRDELLEVLGDPRLAQAGHLGQFRHTALGCATQRHQAQPDRVGKRLELRQ